MSTRKKIVHNAIRLFCTSGYKKTTLRKIAVEVGLSEPSLFHHFKSKNELAKKVVLIYIATLNNLCKCRFELNPEIFSSARTQKIHWWCLHYKVLRDNPPFAEFYHDFYKNGHIEFVRGLLAYPFAGPGTEKSSVAIPEDEKEIEYTINTAMDICLAEMCYSGIITTERAAYEMLRLTQRIFSNSKNIEQISYREIKKYFTAEFGGKAIELLPIILETSMQFEFTQ